MLVNTCGLRARYRVNFRLIPSEQNHLFSSGCLLAIVKGQQVPIAALQVINAVKDLSEGELSRMWNRDPMLQLSTALHESIFKLPPSKLQSHYLENAKHALLALVDRGKHPISSVDGILHEPHLSIFS